MGNALDWSTLITAVLGFVMLAPVALALHYAEAYWQARHRPPREGFCAKCDYDLRGTIDAGHLACPECGHPIDA